jgi:TPR repeat protein
MQIQTPRVHLCALALLVAGCGGMKGGGAARPKDPKATDALGAHAISCDAPPAYSEPLVVDWSSAARLDLELAMQEGLVPVRYTCDEFRIVKGCKVQGDYIFAGVSRKEDVIEIENAAELAVNFRVNVASLQGSVGRGSALHLAMVLVGKRSSTASSITTQMLEGDCAAATHVVRASTLGAFAMASGAAGHAKAAAELFGIGGGSASTESRKQSLSQDGQLESCATASPTASDPPEQCQSPIRVELVPIAAASSTAKVETKDARLADPCPAGFVSSAGKCTRPQTDAPRQCKDDDPADCKVQCDKGDLASCYNLARSIEEWHASTSLYASTCERGFGRACSLGSMLYLYPDNEERKPTAREVETGRKMLESGCYALGDQLSCYSLGEELSHLQAGGPIAIDGPEAIAAFERGCALGDPSSCDAVAIVYLYRPKVAKRDREAARRWWTRACDGGLTESCEQLAALLVVGKDGMEKDVAGALDLRTRACETADDACGYLAQMVADGIGLAPDPARARELFARACKAGDDEACPAARRLAGK